MEKLDYSYEVHKVKVNDQLEIAYIDEGNSKEVLLFIHGLGSNLKAWQKNIDELSKYFRCIAIDLPGYGKSEKNGFQYDMTFFAQAVYAFINKLNLQNITLIGHSMGGQIASHLVLNNKDFFNNLILIAPAGFETFADPEKQWFKKVYQSKSLKNLSEKQITKNFHLNFENMPNDALFMIDDRLLMKSDVAEYDFFCKMIPKCVFGMLNEPVYENLSKIELSTLIFFGENDRLIPNKFLHPEYSSLQMAMNGHKKIEGSQLVMLSDAGHFVQWEKSVEVNQYILDFLNKNKSDS